MRVTVVMGMVLGCFAGSASRLQAGWLGDCAGMPSGNTMVCDSGFARRRGPAAVATATVASRVALPLIPMVASSPTRDG